MRVFRDLALLSLILIFIPDKICDQVSDAIVRDIEVDQQTLN